MILSLSLLPTLVGCGDATAEQDSTKPVAKVSDHQGAQQGNGKISPSDVAERLDTMIAACASQFASGNPVRRDEAIKEFVRQYEEARSEYLGKTIKVRVSVERIDRQGAYVKSLGFPMNDPYGLTRFLAGRPWDESDLEYAICVTLNNPGLNAMLGSAPLPSRIAGWMRRGTDIDEASFKALSVGDTFEREMIIDHIVPWAGKRVVAPSLFADLQDLDFGDPRFDGDNWHSNGLLEQTLQLGTHLLVTGHWADPKHAEAAPATDQRVATSADILDESLPTSDKRMAEINAMVSHLERVTAIINRAADERSHYASSELTAWRIDADFNDIKPYVNYGSPETFQKHARSIGEGSVWTLLHHAAMADNAELVRAASAQLFSPVQGDALGVTPLHVAAMFASADTVRLMLPDRFIQDAEAAERQFAEDLQAPDAGGIAAVKGRRYWAEYASHDVRGAFDGRAAWWRCADTRISSVITGTSPGVGVRHGSMTSSLFPELNGINDPDVQAARDIANSSFLTKGSWLASGRSFSASGTRQGSQTSSIFPEIDDVRDRDLQAARDFANNRVFTEGSRLVSERYSPATGRYENPGDGIDDMERDWQEYRAEMRRRFSFLDDPSVLEDPAMRAFANVMNGEGMNSLFKSGRNASSEPESRYDSWWTKRPFSVSPSVSPVVQSTATSPRPENLAQSASVLWNVKDAVGLTPLDYAIIANNDGAKELLRLVGYGSSLTADDTKNERLAEALWQMHQAVGRVSEMFAESDGLTNASAPEVAEFMAIMNAMSEQDYQTTIAAIKESFNDWRRLYQQTGLQNAPETAKEVASRLPDLEHQPRRVGVETALLIDELTEELVLGANYWAGKAHALKVTGQPWGDTPEREVDRFYCDEARHLYEAASFRPSVDAARRLLTPAAESYADPRAMYELGMLDLRLGNIDTAKAWLTKANNAGLAKATSALDDIRNGSALPRRGPSGASSNNGRGRN
ncbi:MAG: ankyrin repeat domain-containing protein [Phycisphaeraceae bacterium]|nr:ankyrin repeat domain-containing protein [Phycisphaerales bacterium]MCB9843642.1 ankyrin repeat domain-containing protein [Phycisphaeraceae bacterium]